MARLLRLAGISARRPRCTRATTDSHHTLPVADNVLKRVFEARTPNTKRAADITYIDTHEGWLYLAVVMDLFQVLHDLSDEGFEISREMGAALSPYLTWNIKRFGDYTLDMTTRRSRSIAEGRDCIEAQANRVAAVSQCGVVRSKSSADSTNRAMAGGTLCGAISHRI